LNKALLQGVRVLDLSRVLAGPWAGQILADLGADVVKVERTGVGDDTRRWGPPYFRNETTGVEEAAFFIGCNRGKRSIEVDFTTREGQDLVRALAAKADVVIENFKVGGLAKYGLDHESLRREFPSLIYCSITGFGQDGPYAERAGYDFVMQGLGGLMSVTGEPDSVPGGGPMKVGPAVTDIMTGVYAAATICAALYERKSTGQGRFIDMALLDVQVASMANFGWNYLVTGKDTERMGNSVPSLVPYEAFRTADGHMIVAVGNDGQFARFANAIGRPDLAVDERWVFGHDRVHHRQALTDIIKPILLTRPDRRVDRHLRGGRRARRSHQQDVPGLCRPAGRASRAEDDHAPFDAGIDGRRRLADQDRWRPAGLQPRRAGAGRTLRRDPGRMAGTGSIERRGKERRQDLRTCRDRAALRQQSKD
jgi:formyl-CoA transferase